MLIVIMVVVVMLIEGRLISTMLTITIKYDTHSSNKDEGYLVSSLGKLISTLEYPNLNCRKYINHEQKEF